MEIGIDETDQDVGTTRISPKGQVVIPQRIREQLSIAPGSHFAVYGKGDTIIFKILHLPTPDEMKGIMSIAQE